MPICARWLATGKALSRVELGRQLGEQLPGVATEALSYAVTYLEPMVQVPPRGVWGAGSGSLADVPRVARSRR